MTRELTFLEALREGLWQALDEDPRVLLLGEDIGAYGGAFKVTEGLQARFGRERVIDTPLAEAALVGAAIGAAMAGLRAVAELQFIDFVSCAGFDQLVSVAAKSRYRTGIGVPLVLRGPAGAGGRGGPFHSSCPEMWAVATPGLKVVFPSTPYDAKGLLRSAIEDDDPVLFLEHKFLYRRARGDVPPESYRVPLGRGIVRHPGDDLAIVTYGAMVDVALSAAATLATEGHSARVVDLRSLVPLDEEIIAAAAIDTGRVIVLHEHPRRGGLAGEVIAVIHERAFDYLDAPVRRVTGADTPVPYAPTLEDAYLPSASDVVRIAHEVLRY
ncbi:MAG: transketolase C-terminal domain-containing protein [Myxococcota bacterium]